jgi:hypothetical protein
MPIRMAFATTTALALLMEEAGTLTIAIKTVFATTKIPRKERIYARAGEMAMAVAK